MLPLHFSWRLHCLLTWCAPGGPPHPTHSSLLATTAPHRVPPVLKKSHLILRQPLGCCWSSLICSDVPTTHKVWKRDDVPTRSLRSSSWPWRGPRWWCPPHCSGTFAADLSMCCHGKRQKYSLNEKGLVPADEVSVCLLICSCYSLCLTDMLLLFPAFFLRAAHCKEAF